MNLLEMLKTIFIPLLAVFTINIVAIIPTFEVIKYLLQIIIGILTIIYLIIKIKNHGKKEKKRTST